MESQLSTSVKNGYVLARGLAYGLALAFALYYSKLLGVENRSIVTLIFTNTVISLTIFSSGIGLLFRSRALDPVRPIPFRPFQSLALVAALLTSVTVLSVVLIYSHIRYTIPPVLIILSTIYSFFLVLDDLSHQSLIAYRKFQIAAILDVSTIILQVFIFVSLSLLSNLSLAVILFLAIITSYTGSVYISYMTIRKSQCANVGKTEFTVKELLKQSKAFHLVGISSGLVDRVDRLLIGWFLPLSFLGAYAVGTSLLTYLRFIPEAIGRLIVARQEFNHLMPLNRIRYKRIVVAFFILLTVPFAIFLSQSVVVILLGKEWEISSWIVAAFAVQEILRGLYTFIISRKVKDNSQDFILKSSLFLIIGSLIGGYIGIKLFSGLGVPISIGLIYASLIVYSWFNHKQSSNLMD